MNVTFTLKRKLFSNGSQLVGVDLPHMHLPICLHYELFALQKDFKIVSALEIKVLYNGNKIILSPIKSKQKNLLINIIH